MSLPNPALTRRRALTQTFLFSAALALGSRARLVQAQETAGDDLHFLMIGDWGNTKDNKAQLAVAAGMKGYAEAMKLKTEGLFLVGDNFYGEFKGGVHCPRWKTDFEDMYPASVFPGPCWAMLGNHDYDDEPVSKMNAELTYASAHPGTRWYLPSKWYRLEWPKENPLFTAIVLDSNYHNRVGQLTPEERAAQLAWLKDELAKPRATPWLIALGHHPLYSNGLHGDTGGADRGMGPIVPRAQRGFLFLRT